ncbi:hypothetical protein B9479_004678 [Cryptococcus floricola]|uniref:Cyclin n=1 Tax=Cryptococcus floricola TaxID=2591691 RepID=A0A5D3AVM5_9TREE|nr:hypothetical protein B9479_004678 [Cryptococcus floricola]
MPDQHELDAHHPSPRSSAATTVESQAGPSQSRSSSKDSQRSDTDERPRPDKLSAPPQPLPSAPRGPSSPTTELSPLGQSALTPHLDICKYPTQQLLKLLAGLLQHIATSNDELRAESEEEQGESESERGGEKNEELERKQVAGGHKRSHSRASAKSVLPGSSPTTALFDGTPTPSSHSRSTSTMSSSSRQTTYPLSRFPLFSASTSSLSHPSALLAFHARHVPSISIEAYLLRILKYCPTTNEVFLGVLVYFDRMTKLGTVDGIGGEGVRVGKNAKGFAIDSFNVHRLVIAGVTVASKFFSDVFYTNSRYAKVGGLPPTELNSLELQFLLLNDFRLRVSVDEMQRYGDRLLAYAEEAGLDIGEVGVERRKSLPDAEEGLGYGRREASARGERRAAVIGDTQSASIDSPTTTDTASQSQSQSQAPLPPNAASSSSSQAPGPATAPVSPRAKSASLDTFISNPSRSQPAPQSQTQPQLPTHPSEPSLPSASASGVSVSDGSTVPVPRAGKEVGEVSAGIKREWGRGDESVAAVGGRMTSPMRD